MARILSIVYVLFDLSVLLITLTLLGQQQVPAHRDSIWMDSEFSGWVAPIANRLHEGTVLYVDGAHQPLPPLPSVFMHWTHAGPVTWYDDNLQNYLLQSATLLTMYAVLLACFPRPIPFLAAFVSLPIFLALPKSVGYDSFVQCETAITAGLIAASLNRRTASGWGWIVAAGFVTAAAILTKQSTAAGLTIGAVAALWLFSPRQATRRVAIYGLSTACFAVLLMLLLRPHVDLQGMLVDVYLRGSEPKGGTGLLARHLFFYLVEILLFAVVCLAFVAAVMGHLGERSRWRAASWAPSIDIPSAAAMAFAALLPPLGFLTLPNLGPLWHLQSLMTVLAWSGLFSLALGVANRLFAKQVDTDGRIPGLFVVLFSAAIFHSFSVETFRWTYDNNPLIVLAVAAMLGAVFQLMTIYVPELRWRRVAQCVFVVGVVALAWAHYAPQWVICQACFESWPEIAHLNDAKLRPAAAGMRDVVSSVRAFSTPTDEVLLLPNDPNVEAWFERPRPKLTSSVLFVDQYWDRFVDEDFERLLEHPPKVILIGPRDYWRDFSHQWQEGTGCERLIDLVSERLLPARYRLQETKTISFGKGQDYVDIYVRVD